MKPFGPDYQKRTGKGITGLECVLCGRPTDGRTQIEVNHERSDWPREDDSRDAVSAYPIGPDCAKKLTTYRKAHVQPLAAFFRAR